MSYYETYDRSFKPMLEHYKPLIVVSKHRLEVQT